MASFFGNSMAGPFAPSVSDQDPQYRNIASMIAGIQTPSPLPIPVYQSIPLMAPPSRGVSKIVATPEMRLANEAADMKGVQNISNLFMQNQEMLRKNFEPINRGAGFEQINGKVLPSAALVGHMLDQQAKVDDYNRTNPIVDQNFNPVPVGTPGSLPLALMQKQVGMAMDKQQLEVSQGHLAVAQENARLAKEDRQQALEDKKKPVFAGSVEGYRNGRRILADRYRDYSGKVFYQTPDGKVVNDFLPPHPEKPLTSEDLYDKGQTGYVPKPGVPSLIDAVAEAMSRPYITNTNTGLVFGNSDPIAKEKSISKMLNDANALAEDEGITRSQALTEIANARYQAVLEAGLIKPNKTVSRMSVTLGGK